VLASKGGKAAAAAVAALVAAAVVISFLYLRGPRATRTHVGDVAPDFTLPALVDGTPGRLSSTRGRPVLLVFFDTRWPTSEVYVPNLERLYRRYARRGLRMIGVSLDTDVAAARAFVARNPLTFTILSDPGAAKVAATYGTPRDPEAYLLDPHGRVEAVFTEPVDWRNLDTKDKLERHLAPPEHGAPSR
jgi:peroxiredoxin